MSWQGATLTDCPGMLGEPGSSSGPAVRVCQGHFCPTATAVAAAGWQEIAAG
jgi:hypothetical protein